MSTNRFGFSTKKPTNPRPPSNHQFSSASVNRVSSIGSIGKSHISNPSFTPSLGFHSTNQQKQQHLFSWGKDASSVPKPSTGKKFSFGTSGRIPSTGKHSNAMPNMGYASEKPTKLMFGMTPKHSRSSFMHQNGVASTSRRHSARSSMGGRGGKDNQSLSDPAFHRKCQEKIFNFLTANNYQITKQNLVRPSLSEVSRIFEFLFSFFYPDIVIKNGPNTSLDVVAPKILAELGYPFQLKRADLQSFSGGRQLGTVLESICFVIDVISYCENANCDQFNKQFEMEECAFDINTQLTELAFENIDSEEIIDPVREQLNTLANGCFGTNEELEKLKADEENLQEKLDKINQEIDKCVKLPNEIQVYKDENESYDQYLQDVAKKNADHQKTIKELMDELKDKEDALQKAVQEKKRLDSVVDSQKEVVMQYRLSIERKSQINEEMEAVKQQIKSLNELILTTTLEVNKQKTQNSTFVGDLEDVITLFFNTIRASKISQISPHFADFCKTFEEDKEWKKLENELNQYRNWNIGTPSDNLIREVTDFGQRFQNKFKDFKHKLLQQLSTLGGSASIDLICKRQELKALLEKKQQHCAECEADLKRFIAEKEAQEKDETSKINQLHNEIDSAKKRILEAKKKNDQLEIECGEMEEAIVQLERTIQDKERQFMSSMAEISQRRQEYLKSVAEERKQMVSTVKQMIAESEATLVTIKSYAT